MPRKGTSSDPLPPAPPFWIADVALPVADEMGSESMPARAFNPGDRVPAEHVERFGWQAHVHAPPGDWQPPDPGPPPEANPSETGPARARQE
jgi:hypothetical protein